MVRPASFRLSFRTIVTAIRSDAKMGKFTQKVPKTFLLPLSACDALKDACDWDVWWHNDPSDTALHACRLFISRQYSSPIRGGQNRMCKRVVGPNSFGLMRPSSSSTKKSGHFLGDFTSKKGLKSPPPHHSYSEQSEGFLLGKLRYSHPIRCENRRPVSTLLPKLSAIIVSIADGVGATN